MEGSVMMNQKQRDHFIDRVKDKCSTKINALKALHAADIQSTADAKYDAFVDALGLTEDMHALQTAEQIWDDMSEKIRSILGGLKDLNPTADARFYVHRSQAYADARQFLMGCCRNSAENEFYNTEAGQELKTLEDTQTQAIDTIMMDGSKVADLTLKLNGILGNSGMQLLVEGTQV